MWPLTELLRLFRPLGLLLPSFRLMRIWKQMMTLAVALALPVMTPSHHRQERETRLHRRRLLPVAPAGRRPNGRTIRRAIARNEGEGGALSEAQVATAAGAVASECPLVKPTDCGGRASPRDEERSPSRTGGSRPALKAGGRR